MPGNDMSSVRFRMRVVGLGEVVGEFNRSKTPKTVFQIIKMGRFRGRITVEEGFVGFITNVIAGHEKSRKDFQPGDVGYQPLNRGLWVAVTKARAKLPMNPVGKVTNGLEVLRSVKSGEEVILEVVS